MSTPVSNVEIIDVETGESRNAQKVNITKKGLDTVHSILDRLRKWHSWDVRRRKSLRWYLLSLLFPRRQPHPELSELEQLAHYFFTPRAEIKFTICDFDDNRFDRFDVTTIDALIPRPFSYCLCEYNM